MLWQIIRIIIREHFFYRWKNSSQWHYNCFKAKNMYIFPLYIMLSIEFRIYSGIFEHSYLGYLCLLIS